MGDAHLQQLRGGRGQPASPTGPGDTHRCIGMALLSEGAPRGLRTGPLTCSSQRNL